MISRNTITRSILLSMTGALMVFWLMAIGLSSLIMRHEFDEVFDSALREAGDRLLEIFNDDVNLSLTTGNKQAPHDLTEGYEYLIFQVRRSNGDVVLRSNDAPDKPFTSQLTAGFQDTDTYRIYTKVSPNNELFLQVADSFGDRRDAVRESAAAMLIPLLAFIPASSLAIWIIVNRTLRPIDKLRRAIGSKDGGNLEPVEIGRLPGELLPIARSVNLLLDRLQTAFDTEREFTANSAHELRTPIAGALAQTQRLVVDLPEGEWKQRAATVEYSVSKLGRLVEKFLQLAKANFHIEVVDVSPILEMLMDEFQRSSEENERLQYRRCEMSPTVHEIDVDAFGIVMRNLIENALAHGEPATPVHVSVALDGSIHVVNECAIVSKLTLRSIKRRFVRGSTGGVGSGLGLAIADRLVIQMGGKLDLKSPALGRDTGFEAVVSFGPSQLSGQNGY